MNGLALKPHLFRPYLEISAGKVELLILTIGIPIVIHIFYIIPAPVWWMETDWEAGNVLEYYGAILGFLSTTALSALALYQNYELKKEADAKQALIEKMEYMRELPLFVINNSSCNGDYSNLKLSILNVSDNAAYDMNIGNFTVENAQGEIILKSKSATINRTDLLGRVENRIEFVNDRLLGKDLKILFQIKCKDKFQKIHTYSATYQVEDATKFSGKKPYKVVEI